MSYAASADASRSTSPSDAHVETARGQDGCQLVRARVHLDQEPFRAAPDVVERPCVHDLAALDDHDRVADPLGLLEVVRRQEDVHPELRPDAADEGEHLRALHRIEPVRGLVEEDELGVVRDRGGELHPLPLAGRHRPDRAEALLAEPDQPERVVRSLYGGAGGKKVHLGEVPHEVVRGELRRQVVMLGRVADARAHLDSGGLGIAPENAQLAAGPRPKPEHQRDEGRLPGAVRAEQAGDPGPDLGVEPGERDRAAVALHNSARGDDRRGGVSHHRRAFCASVPPRRDCPSARSTGAPARTLLLPRGLPDEQQYLAEIGVCISLLVEHVGPTAELHRLACGSFGLGEAPRRASTLPWTCRQSICVSTSSLAPSS